MKISRLLFLVLLLAGLGAPVWAETVTDPSPEPSAPPADNSMHITLTQPAAGSAEEVKSGAHASIGMQMDLNPTPTKHLTVNVPEAGASFCLSDLMLPAGDLHWATANFTIVVPTQDGTSATITQNLGGCFAVSMPAGSVTEDYLVYGVEFPNRPIKRYGVLSFNKTGSY